MIQREDKIEQSVQDYLKLQLFNVRGYPQSQVEIMDSFQGDEFQGTLDKNYVAVGFNFDDGGREAEVGSALTVKLHTIEFFVIARNATWGRNLSAAIANSLDSDRIIPLKDIGSPGTPVIDALPVISCSREHQPIPNPQPWQKFIWTVHLKLEDIFDAALT